MAKHTPGPWQCYADLPSTEPNWHIVTNASRMRVLAHVHIETGNDTDEANARLITVVPELFEELKRLRLAYVNLLEIGRDRILAFGGSCDPVDVMEASDPALRAVDIIIAKAEDLPHA